MGLLDRIRNQFSAVVEWKNQPQDVLWWKYDGRNEEIKNASKLIVAPGQGCVLVYEGAITEVLTEPGIYLLETANHPFITTLLKLRQGFESEHKLYLFFFRTAAVLNQPWGTAERIKYLDEAYKIPVELGANGNFSYQISDIQQLYTQMVGSKDVFRTRDLREIITTRLAQLIGTALAQNKYSYRDIDSNLNTISATLQPQLAADAAVLGVTLTDFRITGTDFDAQTKARIDRVSDVSVDVLAAGTAGLDYVALEKLRALRDAARNEGGLAGAGAQLGAGMEIGRMFNDTKKDLLEGDKGDDVVAALRKLKVLLDEEIITPEEFETKKKALLDTLG